MLLVRIEEVVFTPTQPTTPFVSVREITMESSVRVSNKADLIILSYDFFFVDTILQTNLNTSEGGIAASLRNISLVFTF